MKKLLVIGIIMLCCGCAPTKDLVDYDLFKNELNSAIVESGFNTDYRVK